MTNKIVIVLGFLILAAAVYAGGASMRTRLAVEPERNPVAQAASQTASPADNNAPEAPPPVPPEPIDPKTAQELYAGIIAEHTAQMVQKSKAFFDAQEEYADLEGINFYILDLNGNGQPELLVAYVGCVQASFMQGYYLYGLKDKQPVLLQQKKTEGSLPYPESLGDTQHLFRVSDPSGQSYAALWELAYGESVYATALVLHRFVLDDAGLLLQTVHSIPTNEKRFTGSDGYLDDDASVKDLRKRWQAYAAQAQLETAPMPGLYSGLVAPKETPKFSPLK